MIINKGVRESTDRLVTYILKQGETDNFQVSEDKDTPGGYIIEIKAPDLRGLLEPDYVPQDHTLKATLIFCALYNLALTTELHPFPKNVTKLNNDFRL